MVNFLTWIPDCDSHSPILLDLFLYPNTSICSTMALPPFRNSDDVSVFMGFLSNLKWDALFNCIAYANSCADWDNLADHLRDVSWKDIFKLSATAATSEFSECVQVGIDLKRDSIVVNFAKFLVNIFQISEAVVCSCF